MINDPELKAMSDVYDALKGLDAATQRRVTDWVLAKLKSPVTAAAVSKRGPKPGKKRGRKPGRPKAAAAATGAKRGPKPGRKRGRPGRPKAAASATKKAGRRGRPPGTGKKAAGAAGKRRGRPRKSAGSSPATNANA